MQSQPDHNQGCIKNQCKDGILHMSVLKTLKSSVWFPSSLYEVHVPIVTAGASPLAGTGPVGAMLTAAHGGRIGGVLNTTSGLFRATTEEEREGQSDRDRNQK